jgi:hypothetical protein
MKTENLSTLKIHKLTQAQYVRELEAGNLDKTALYLTPEEQTDCIVEQTTQQNADGSTWTYRKWNSGFAECWYTGVFSVDSCTKEFGGLYVTPSSDTIIYPFTFLETPMVSVVAYGTSGSYCFGTLEGLGTTLITPSISFVSNVSGQTDIPYRLTVIGKWK